jgi:hypothetical protein
VKLLWVAPGLGAALEDTPELRVVPWPLPGGGIRIVKWIAEVRAQRPDVAAVVLCARTAAAAVTLAGLRVPLLLVLDAPLGEAGVAITAALLAAKQIVAATPAIAEASAQAVPKPIAVMAPQWADPLPPKAQARRELRLLPEQKVALLLGVLDHGQRLDLLAEAHRHCPGVALLVCGEGPRAQFVSAMEISARPSSPVIDLGPLERRTVTVALAAADLGVSAREAGIGAESVAYAAAGLPQVILQAPGSSALRGLFPGDPGAVIAAEPPAPAAFAAAIAAQVGRGAPGPPSGAATLPELVRRCASS